MTIKFKNESCKNQGGDSTIIEYLDDTEREWKEIYYRELCFNSQESKFSLKVNYELNLWNKKVNNRKLWKKRKQFGGPYENMIYEELETEIYPSPQFIDIDEKIPEYFIFKRNKFNGSYSNYNEKVEKFKLRIISSRKHVFKSETSLYSNRKISEDGNSSNVLTLEILFYVDSKEFQRMKTLFLSEKNISVSIKLERVEGIFESEEYSRIYKILTRQHTFEMGYEEEYDNLMYPTTLGQVGHTSYEITLTERTI